MPGRNDVMVIIDIANEDVRSFVQGVLCNLGVSCTDIRGGAEEESQNTVMTLYDVDAYQVAISGGISPAGVFLVLGRAEALEGLSEQNRLVYPFRAGRLADKLQPLLTGRYVAFPAQISFSHFILMPSTLVIEDRDTGNSVKLTEKERDILVFLSDQNGRTVDRTSLLQAIWGYVDGVETHTLETHIYRLRQKIEFDPANPSVLRTVGDGYVLDI